MPRGRYRVLSSIRSKIIAGLLLIVLIAGATSVVLYLSLTRGTASFGDVVGRQLKHIEACGDIRYWSLVAESAMRGFVLDPEKESLRNQHDSAVKAIDEALKEMQTVAADQREIDSISALRSSFSGLTKVAESVLSAANDDPETAETFLSGDFAKAREDFLAKISNFIAQAEAMTTSDLEAASKSASRASTISLVSMGAAAVICVLMGLGMANGIANPLTRLSLSAEAIAGGDLTVELPKSKSRDEVGRLTVAFASMATRLKELIDQIFGSAAEVASTSKDLSESSMQSVAAADAIASTATSIAKAAQEQSSGASDAAAAADQLTRAIAGVFEGAQGQLASVQRASSVVQDMSSVLESSLEVIRRVGDAVRSNSEAAGEGNRLVRAVIERMGRIKTSSDATAGRMAELREISSEIKKIVDVIEGIASQTNLLALNAAIEAARAGEHGRGFAVVADEVRKLSEKSSQETKAISALIDRIGAAIEKTAEAVAGDAEEIESGNAITHDAGQALERIAANAQEAERLVSDLFDSSQQLREATSHVTEAMEQIVSVTEQNSAATEEMSTSANEVKRLMETVAAASEESAAAAEEVSASTEQMRLSIQQVNASAQSLAQMADKLRQAVSAFRL